ncbi:hypothetical protein B9T19_09185 [Ignatzschineria sp. F8392]|nr:ATP-binding protein [Ignatzschineria sp. F8392]OYQ77941.1 hypothetical protein B9T19_09185 [Ignatzschineria sp. F8392]
MKISPKLIQNILGEESISNSVIVLSEIIKNAYESGANEIIIDLSNKDHIKIQDNGSGLNPEELYQAWNVIGDSKKANNPNALGGKGIGRFTLFYIANTIQVYTKTKNSQAVYFLEITNDELSQTEDLNELELSVKVADIDFPYESGTLYYLYGIDLEAISYTMIYYDIAPILQPFKKYPIDIKILYPKSSKEIIIRNDENYHLNHLKPEFSINYAPFSIKAIFENGEFHEITYSVKQIYDKEHFIVDRAATKTQLADLNDRVLEQGKKPREGINLTKDDYKILNKIYFNFYNYYFSKQFIDKKDKKKIQDNFLNAYTGVNIYRGGFKIYGHGREDWLNLSAQQSQQTKLIYNEIIFGLVELDPSSKNTLREVSSREKLFNNNSYKALKIITNELVRFFALEVREKYKKDLLSKKDWEAQQKVKTLTDTSSSDTPSSGTSSSDTASSDTSSSDTASSDTASSDTASSDTASSDTASSDTASSGTSSNDTSSNDEASRSESSSKGGLPIDRNENLIKRSILKDNTSISSSKYWNNLIEQINYLSQLKKKDYTELITSAIRQVLESYIHLVYDHSNFPYDPSKQNSLEKKVENIFKVLRQNDNGIVTHIAKNNDLKSAFRSFNSISNLLRSDYTEINLEALINKTNITAHSGSQFTSISAEEYQKICNILDLLYLFKISYQYTKK